jgi:hypothetical protein
MLSQINAADTTVTIRDLITIICGIILVGWNVIQQVNVWMNKRTEREVKHSIRNDINALSTRVSLLEQNNQISGPEFSEMKRLLHRIDKKLAVLTGNEGNEE